MWQDKINGLFEFMGGIFILLHCIKLYHDKKVRGVSFVATAYFVLWGYWNIHYYPHLKQWMSFAGGLTIVAMNTLWIAMMVYYIRKEKMAIKHKRKATIAIDFDGVIHSFKSGWQGHRKISDPPIEGAIEWLKMLIHSNKVVPSIYSARSWKLLGNWRMKKWLIKYGLTKKEVKQLKFWVRKPIDDFILDDRCRRFRGKFPPTNEIVNFKPWHGHTVFGD